MRSMLQSLSKRPLWQYLLPITAGAILAVLLIPPEQTLGTGIRLIYFHAAWIWTGITLGVLAAIFGLAAVAARKERLHQASAALARAGLIFLLTYLPMAMLVMKIVWNGYFFTEPRWSVPFSLTLAYLLVQIGVLFINKPVLSSLANLSFGVILVYNLATLQSVLHPESPIFTSGSMAIRAAFLFLFFFIFCGGMLLTICMHRIEPALTGWGKK
jgi:hypothetical protein